MNPQPKQPMLHERPGYKRVPITLVLHIYDTIPSDWEDEGRFHLEENHCIDNYVTALWATKERHEHPTKPIGVCTTCSRAEVYLGHVPFEAIRTVQPAPGTTNPHAEDMEASDEDPWADERRSTSPLRKSDE